VDAVTALSVGLTALRRSSSTALLKYARRYRPTNIYTNRTSNVGGNVVSRTTAAAAGADCNADPVTPSPLGRQLLRSIRQVRL